MNNSKTHILMSHLRFILNKWNIIDQQLDDFVQEGMLGFYEAGGTIGATKFAIRSMDRFRGKIFRIKKHEFEQSDLSYFADDVTKR